MTDVFDLDPAAKTLSGQLAENIRRAIASGDFKPGDKLPSLREMAKRCKTSLRVPLAAIDELTKDGLVRGHSRSGVVVLESRRRACRGNVLFVCEGGYVTYYREALFRRVSIRLTEAGWRTSYAYVESVGCGGRIDTASLRAELNGDCDLVFGTYCDKSVLDAVRASGVPFASLASLNSPAAEGALGQVAFCSAAALVDFAEDCQRKGVRRLLMMELEPDVNDVRMLMRKHGVTVETIIVRPRDGASRLEEIEAAGFESLSKRLADNRKARPDVVYFADDFLAHGGIWAIEAAGLRAPRDIGFVTFANKHRVPNYLCPVTRIEKDLQADADKIADGFIAYLAGGTFPGVLLDSVRYVGGGTF